MHRYPADSATAPVLVLAPGAGAGEQHPWMKTVAQGLADRGVSVATFDFPYRKEGRRVPDRGPVLEAALVEAWTGIAAKAGARARLFAGGKSMGGRITSQVAGRHGLAPAPAGLVFFGYPLHPAGKPAQRRDRHLPDIDLPMLFLSGSRDPFASPDELRTLMAGLPLATLELFDTGDHSLIAPTRLDPAGALLGSALDRAAGWMLET